MLENISRRDALHLFAIGGMGLLLPKAGYAQELTESQLVTPSSFVSYTENVTNDQIFLYTQEEARKIIEWAKEKDSELKSASRPTYSTRYGDIVHKSTGWHDIAGQPEGGVMIVGGGSASVAPNGGGSVTVTVSLPGGVGSVTLSIPKARQVFYVTNWNVNIPGDGYYKLTANVTHKIQPYVVYKHQNGNSTVYAKSASNTFFRMAVGKRKVG